MYILKCALVIVKCTLQFPIAQTYISFYLYIILIFSVPMTSVSEIGEPSPNFMKASGYIRYRFTLLEIVPVEVET